jgi:predicted short-subunit dehydrogenase-like oxidoreductase (DUF2520 family)
MRKLNVIGAGRVGRALAALFHRAAVFELQSIASRTFDAAAAAAAFAGAGAAAERIDAMPAADVWLVTTPDRAIAQAARILADAGLLRAGDVVFHCSGALASGELAAAAACGAHVASVHPLKTFAAPDEAVRTFAGTPCVAEGDAQALQVLEPAFDRLGARVLHIGSAGKTLYHAASVIVCNDLVALLETGLRCYERAGIPRTDALPLIEPIVRETVAHVFGAGTVRALTGPISRGDETIVARHVQALDATDAQAAAVYRALGLAAVELAKAQGGAPDEALARIRALLEH